MTSPGLKRALWIPLAATLLSGPARAQVVQTDAAQTPLPQPVSTAEITLSRDLGWSSDRQLWKDFEGNNLNPPALYTDYFPTFVTGDAVTLDGLFKWRGEQIDPIADARIEPGHFSPACGFTAELVLRGGNCNVGFGWYNFDPDNPRSPAANEIYELLPSNIETFMQCTTQNGELQPEGTGFCPFGWDNHHPYNPPQLAWTPRAIDSGTIASDPRYLGKSVAFAMIGNPSGICTQSKYSIAEHNVINTGGQPWITTLIWQSTADPEGFYLAFEDLPMSPADWRVPGTGGPNTNDGDFNDFVFYVTGVSCKGGGQPCDTGLLGACSLGRTDCEIDGIPPLCRAIIQPGAELCDNVDNDCNGVVDDGDGLCPTGYACQEGLCVNSCSTGEFPCADGYECFSGLCVETACAGVDCPAGQACRAGVCVEPCTGVVCPGSQECQLGRCIDPCAAITCPQGRVCERGLCVSDCHCRPCADGLTCGADGRCTDPACADVTCPEGLRCSLGNCVDPCDGVTCPGDGVCINGACTDPTGVVPEEGVGGTTIIGVDPDRPMVPGTSGTGASGPGSSLGAPEGSSGCGCRAASRSDSTASLGALLALALGAAAAQRRRHSRPS